MDNIHVYVRLRPQAAIALTFPPSQKVSRSTNICFSSFSYAVKSYQKIERAIESVSLGDNEKVGDYEGVKASTGTNKIASLVATINTVINKNIQLNKRVTSIEVKAQATSLSPGRGAAPYDVKASENRSTEFHQLVNIDNNPHRKRPSLPETKENPKKRRKDGSRGFQAGQRWARGEWSVRETDRAYVRVREGGCVSKLTS
ncbi:hypothetical protein PENSUB_7751 [Penicillium subrubescens]|uniref:Uncharacterized protein n=1 Tax=Penicillium subrubescens TaxID=1316194 RepID=A0A1Q5TK51_9EURO|nr:hypothetical protein PENSUB_7751 [Penicillium subrubescens]